MPSIYQLLWQMIRYAQKLYWLDTILWLFILGLPIVPGLLIRQFFDTLTDQTKIHESPWVWIALFLAIGLARMAAIFSGRVTKTQHRFLMSGLVRHNLLRGLLHRPGAALTMEGVNGQKISPGEILSYFRDDALQIEDTVVGTNEIFAAGVFAVVSVALLLSVNREMTLLVFLPLCLIAALVHQAEHRLKGYRRASRQGTQQVTGFIGEMFTAVQAIKVAGAETEMLEELRKRGDRRRRLMVRDQVFNAILNSGFANTVSIGTGIILLLAAQSLGPQGNFTVGDFALFVYYLSFVTDFLTFFGGFLASIKQSEVSLERMATLISGVYSSSSEISKSNLFSLTSPQPLYLKPILGSQPALPPLAPLAPSDPLEELSVEGLVYHYPGTNNGITDLSFDLRRGSLTVITGRVGSGKTTLIRALLGLLPKQAGKIVWNGLEIQEPATFFVPPRAAYTPQVPQLFSTSLRENLLLGIDAEISPERLNEAIATAVFDRDLAMMPHGLNTQVGTRGVRLSGGQKQRVAAARMLIREPELLVFDDLSSALDVATEQKLWQRLFDRTKKSDHSPHYTATCLVISHRPSIIERADTIILLEAGRISFSGTPSQFSTKMNHHRKYF
ncbi:MULTISPECIES: ABC transporter ATP-binding protein [unclassified Synechocystis]|uniref:ABC transporter ATP-binding protein n=1 Tax=unclassified Synechocystis TaxID=2640012 RepID=UPI00041D76DD|nr:MULTISPECIES: ABC transporter ATP-binding protein [unclassified Synechocystis]AIE73429.1 ATP-binding protein of ABC transporter [Synechocystis sp. PCC 6714]MCT0254212.1 ABC transporter ATP-binding protein/permease [Synechocystis sp. CS-94]